VTAKLVTMGILTGSLQK